MVKQLFCSSSVSCVLCKAQVASLRLFVFTGVTTSCLLALIARTTSSYLLQFSPYNALCCIEQTFSPSSKPVYFTTKVTTSTDAFAGAKEEASSVEMHDSTFSSMLEDPSASEDFDFEIRVVPSVVCLPVDSCLLVSLANNRQVRFSMSFLSMLVVQFRRSCRWPLVCPSDRNVPRRCLRNTCAGWFWRDEFLSSINLPAVVVPLNLASS